MPHQIAVQIDRTSPVPLYHQLAEQLSESVTSGVLQPGDPFENEVAMADRLGLSRPTVRRAIGELVAQGLLIRRRGLGTTVAARKVHRRAGLTSLWDDLARESARSGTGASTTAVDGHPHTDLLHHELVEDPVASTALDLPVDTVLLAVTRLRYSGDRPLAVMRNWLPPAYSDLTEDQLATEGLYAVLRARGVRPVVAHQTIGARMPTTHERRALRIRGSEPVLTMTRAAFDAAGDPVEYGDHCYRASDYSIDVMVDER